MNDILHLLPKVFSGLTSEEAQSVAFKATVRSSIAYALNLDFSDVLINSVTLASIRRTVLTGKCSLLHNVFFGNYSLSLTTFD